MKKAIGLLLALVLVLTVSLAAADPTPVNGQEPRKITINPAGLNEPIPGYSTTTGRKLDEIYYPNGFVGVAVGDDYQPIMVQISNAGSGIEYHLNGKPYRNAPINGNYADVIYEACQVKGNKETRMSMVFSDTIPDYVGWVRSTRPTHARLRQEWECAFITSGYAPVDVPNEWKALGVKNPAGADKKNHGIVYVGDLQATKPWGPYVLRVENWTTPHNEVFYLPGILQNVIPKDHVPANHTWLFTDDLPADGDEANFIYVSHGNKNSESRLEYDADKNIYYRYVTFDHKEFVYRESQLENPKIKNPGKNNSKLTITGMSEGDEITFSNVIIQWIEMKWFSEKSPDPQLVGTGNADYFMGGKHIAGVWERKDMNSRTVYYGADGNEIQMQRGKTLIVLLDYNYDGTLSYE